MSNNPASMTANVVYEERALVRVQTIDPASNRANHSHPWQLATYLNQKAGRGARVPVRKSFFKRSEAHYTYGPIII